jgi:hypothetical protein
MASTRAVLAGHGHLDDRTIDGLARYGYQAHNVQGYQCICGSGCRRGACYMAHTYIVECEDTGNSTRDAQEASQLINWYRTTRK